MVYQRGRSEAVGFGAAGFTGFWTVFFSAVLLLLAAGAVSPAAAQGGVQSPSAGCSMANSGAYNFGTTSSAENPFTAEFVAGEFLFFSYSSADSILIEDRTTTPVTTIVDAAFPSPATAIYEIPETGTRTFFQSLAVGEISEGTLNVTCESVPQGTITIAKSVDVDATFSFSGDLGAFDLTTSGGSADQTFEFLPFGTYTITEGMLDGYTLDDIMCTGGSFTKNVPNRSVTIDLGSFNGVQKSGSVGPYTNGNDVTCTFINSADPGSITIEKQSDVAGTFDFTSSELGPFSLAPTASTVAAQLFPDLAVGSYTITETANSDFNLTDIDCGMASDATPNVSSGSVAINLSPGEDVTCRFVNAQKTGTIIIEKESDVDGAFDFTGDLGPFTLTTSGGMASQSFVDQTAGTYTVTETANPDFSLSALTCDDGSATDIGSRTATIDLAPGETVTCKFTNSELPGSVTIIKESDVDSTFDFTGDLGAFSITTSGGTGTRDFSSLAAGTYSVTETANPDFSLTSLTCDDPDGGTTISESKATIDVDPGEQIVCTFTNTELPGTINIIKQSDVDGTFSFTGDLGSFSITTGSGEGTQSFSPAAGTYTVTEATNPNFALESLMCTDPDNGTTVSESTATIDLDPGETVTCTFANSQLPGSITIVKESDIDGLFSFTGDLGAFDIATGNGTGMQMFTDLAAGSYVITETDNPAFSLESIICTDSDNEPASASVSLENRQATVDLDPNGAITCTFTNVTNPGQVTVITQTDGEDGTFSYSGGLGAFSITTDSGTGSAAPFTGLDPQTITIVQAANEEFELTDIDCGAVVSPTVDLAAGSIEFTLSARQSVTCTFINEDEFDEDQFKDDSHTAIGGYMYRRARSMLNAEPDRTGFHRSNPGALWEDGENREGVQYAMNMVGGTVQMDVSATTRTRDNTINSVGQVELWVEGHFTKAEDEADLFDIDSEFRTFHLGADIQASENVILGAVVSFDRAEEEADFFDEEGQTFLSHFIEGDGWMAGPYVSARLRDNLFLNGRYAYGESENKLSFPGIVTEDEFDTSRVLARVALTGNDVRGNWRLTPTVSVSYFEEEQKAYVSQTGVAIPAQTLELGRAELEPEIAYRHELSTGTVLEPQLAVAAVWDFETPDDFNVRGINVPTEDLRGRIETGLQINWQNGSSMRFAGSYDGLGSDGYEAYSLQAWYEVPLGPLTRPKKRPPAPLPKAPLPVAPPPAMREPVICPDGTRVLNAEDCEAITGEDDAFTVLFDHDEFVLTLSEIEKIDAAVARAEGRTITVVLLEGHTDLSGSLAYNEPLSLNRAVVVRDALIARGIPADKITYEFFGETRPAVPTEDGVRLRANRRTEVVIRFE